MSNVLIGIIGVILFIGLALAGALYLGAQFSAARNNADAAAVVARLQQITAALELYRTEMGNPVIRTGTADFLVPDYLKTRVTNPTPEGRANPTSYAYIPHFNNDTGMDGNDEGGIPAKYLMIPVGWNGPARKICEQIAKMRGGVMETDPMHPTGRLGCTSDAGGGTFVAYQQIQG